MKTVKQLWLAYTILVGLIPILSRLLVWAVTEEGGIEPFSPQDFIAFGLVLHISGINETEHLFDADESWRMIQNAVSILFITTYGVLFCLTLIGGDVVDQRSIMTCVGVIALGSLFISYRLFNRISALQSIRTNR